MKRLSRKGKAGIAAGVAAAVIIGCIAGWNATRTVPERYLKACQKGDFETVAELSEKDMPDALGYTRDISVQYAALKKNYPETEKELKSFMKRYAGAFSLTYSKTGKTSKKDTDYYEYSISMKEGYGLESAMSDAAGKIHKRIKKEGIKTTDKDYNKKAMTIFYEMMGDAAEKGMSGRKPRKATYVIAVRDGKVTSVSEKAGMATA